MDYLEIIASTINESGRSVADVAMAAGIKPVALERTIRGSRKMTASEMLNLCAVLDIDPRKFL